MRGFGIAALLVFLGLVWLAGCSSCEPAAPDAAPGSPTKAEKPVADADSDGDDDGGIQEFVTEVVDGDRTTKRVVRRSRQEAPDKKAVDYPPDALPYQIALTRENLLVVRFPEYSERVRFSANGYAIMDPHSKRTLILDPGIGNVRMIRFWARRAEADIIAIAVTHGHLDHTGGVAALKGFYPNAIFIAPKLDAEWMGKPEIQYFGGVRADPPPAADRLIAHGDLIEVGELVFDIIATPGHTTGSVCLVLPEENILFSGDTLFRSSIGRTNFSHSLTMADEVASIKTQLKKLSDGTVVYPGHGSPTTLGRERQSNPYLTGKRAEPAPAPAPAD